MNGPSSPPAHEPSDRRRQILDIAAELFALHGYAGTTVRDIATKAGILSGSLYHHVSSKEEMLEEIIRTSLDADIERDVLLAERATLDPAGAVRELFGRSLRFVRDHPHVAAILSRPEQLRGEGALALVARRTSAIRAAWTAVLARCVAVGAFRADLDVDLAYRAMLGVVDTVARWYRPDGELSIEEIADQLATLFLDGMRSSPAGAAG